jgi:hypothetical protein
VVKSFLRLMIFMLDEGRSRLTSSMQRGEFNSVRAAAIEAGIQRPKSEAQVPKSEAKR